MDTPEEFPEGWTLITNETFANMNAWTAYDNEVFNDTILLAEQATIRDGGGLRLIGSDELVGGKYPGSIIHSNAFYSYGFFECYCQFPAGFVKPAFFLYDSRRYYAGALKNEIDAVEYGGGAFFLAGTWKDDVDYTDSVSCASLGGSYHKWGLYWGADAVRVYLDDHLLAVWTENIPTVTLNIELQMCIGEWAPAPTNVTFPANFDVDWVKAWTKDNTYR